MKKIIKPFEAECKAVGHFLRKGIIPLEVKDYTLVIEGIGDNFEPMCYEILIVLEDKYNGSKYWIVIVSLQGNVIKAISLKKRQYKDIINRTINRNRTLWKSIMEKLT